MLNSRVLKYVSQPEIENTEIMHKNIYCILYIVLGLKCLNSKEGQESHDLNMGKQYSQFDRTEKDRVSI